MPTQIPAQEKSDFIDIVKFVNTYEAARLEDLLVYYSDIPMAIGRQLQEYATNPAYLKNCMAVFDDTELVIAGIYNEKSSITPTDPVLIIASTDVDITIFSPPTGVTILGGSQVNEIVLDSGAMLGTAYLGPGTVVNIIDSTATDAYIRLIFVDYLKNSGATLSRVLIGSNFGQIKVTPGASFGGVGYDNQVNCTNPVITPVATNVTNNSIELNWTEPTDPYILITIQFKKTDTGIWRTATANTGEFIGQTGYIFRNLEKDTYYDFSITVTCTNGGISEPELVQEKTTCVE